MSAAAAHSRSSGSPQSAQELHVCLPQLLILVLQVLHNQLKTLRIVSFFRPALRSRFLVLRPTLAAPLLLLKRNRVAIINVVRTGILFGRARLPTLAPGGAIG